jgi:hypothetical protein
MLEDGIGMVRQFIDNFDSWLDHKLSVAGKDTAGILFVTGEAFALVLRELLASRQLTAGTSRQPADKTSVLGARLTCEVIAVENRFFSGNVDVAGLIVAADIIFALQTWRLASQRAGAIGSWHVFLPPSMFNDDGLTLDDFDISRIVDELGGKLADFGFTLALGA